MNLRLGASGAHVRRSLQATVVVAALLMSLTAACAATLEVDVLRADGKPLIGAAVMVHGPAGIPPPPAMAVVIDQVEQTFVPDLVVIPLGSQVTFPNSDSVSHQVYSFAPAKRFQLPLYRGRPYPPVVFDRAGIATLGCNIHDEMMAYVVVTDATWFGRTDGTGSWRAAALPAGAYRIEVWHPRLREAAGNVERELTLGAGTDGWVQLVLTKPLRPEPLSRKPRSWSNY